MKRALLLLFLVPPLFAAIPILFTRPGADGGGGDTTNEVGSFSTNMWIDAEDYDYTDGSTAFGGYFPSQPGTNFNETSLYLGYSATETADFQALDILTSNYRLTTGVADDVHDDDHEPNGVPYTDYKIRAFNGPGNDWFHYTRAFTNGSYRIVARVSSTEAFNYVLNVDGATVASFSATGSGTNTFFYVYFKTNGVPMEIALNGEQTLRVTATNGLSDFHRLGLIRWTGTPQGFANPEPDPDEIFFDESGVAFYDPEI